MLYFAYGSNLLTHRMVARVSNANFVSTGNLTGWRFAFNLRSTDGSAKANAIKTDSSLDTLYGAIYELDDAGKSLLDQFEDLGGAYEIAYAIADAGHGSSEVFLYVGNRERVADNLPPYDWYRALILAGARQHNLSAGFVRMLQACATTRDPDSDRAAANWNLIPNHLRCLP